MSDDVGRTTLHPDAEAYLARLRARRRPPTAALAVEAARRESAAVDAEKNRPAVGEVFDVAVPGPDGSVPLRVYRPDDGVDSGASGSPNADRAVVVYLHGGGFVLGGLEKMDAACRYLAAASGRLVVSVDYRLAPEHPFPAAVRDSLAATRWVVDHADSLGGDPDRVAIAGDSAGGGLAAAVTLALRDFGGPTLERQLLVYPVLDHAFDTPSYAENATGYRLERDDMRWFWDHYLPTDVDGKHPYASPLRARSVEDVPPASVLTCGFDVLRDEGVAYVDRLHDAGVAVEHHHEPDQIHGYVGLFLEPMQAHAERALSALAADLP
jgi:acetyl esterase